MAEEYDMSSKLVRKAVRLALNKLGYEMVYTIRRAINVPVEVLRGPKGGKVVIRSEPGEPPRREIPEVSRTAGKLWRSIKFTTGSKARTVENLKVYTTDPKAPILERGCARFAPRPFFRTTRQGMGDLRTKFKQYFREILRELQEQQRTDAANEDDIGFSETDRF